MRIWRKITEARHFLVLSVLALAMSLFLCAGTKAALQPQSKSIKDPVISSMTWEQPTANSADDGPGDIPAFACNGNCPRNCNPNCVVNCNINCPT
jgi:hypothetical protein